MPTESFGMALSSLPVPTLPSSTPAESSSKKQSASTGSSSTLSASSDPLLAALSQTLAQLGYTMPAGSLDTSSDTNSSGGSTTNSAATTTAAQFLAALYQALALQQSISVSNGGAASVSDDANPAASVADTASSGGSVDAYLDLGSRLTDLSSASRSVDLSNNNVSDADEWDIEFGDVSGPSAEDTSSEEDPLDKAISSLNDALQSHVATLDQEPGASVTLSALLDGLSNNAGGLTWQPVGVMVDLAI